MWRGSRACAFFLLCRVCSRSTPSFKATCLAGWTRSFLVCYDDDDDDDHDGDDDGDDDVLLCGGARALVRFFFCAGSAPVRLHLSRRLAWPAGLGLSWCVMMMMMMMIMMAMTMVMMMFCYVAGLARLCVFSFVPGLLPFDSIFQGDLPGRLDSVFLGVL